MGENFAFFLPIMMASFGVVFGLVWSWRVRTAGFWCGAYFCLAAGFSVPMAAAIFPGLGWSVITNLLFTGGYLLFGQALLERWRPNWLFPLRIAICALSLLLSIVAVMHGDLYLAMAVSSLASFLLIGVPLIAIRGHFDNWADRALFWTTALHAFDNLVRGSTVPITLSLDNVMASEFIFIGQAFGCIFGLFIALTALATIMLDLLAGYQRDALHDPLTGLLNRRGFDEAVAALGRKTIHHGSIVVCDIDHFKTINDDYGHARGDRVIAAVARILSRMAPAGAVTARFGGEEFVLYLPDMNAARAAGIANAIRERLAEEVAAQLGLDRTLTASFGLSTVQMNDRSIHDAIARADEALYEAKARGRNRLCVMRSLSTSESRPIAARVVLA